jgi:hypothetical protein
MSSQARALATGIVVAGFVTAASLAAAAPFQAPNTASATGAASANPELIGQLSKELGVSADKAAGAAGSLFGLAKSKLKPEEFSQIASAVPGMESLLKAAPTEMASAATGTSGALSQLAGSAGGSLGAAASAFSKLGLSPDMVSKAASVLSSYVSKSGGANVASLLTGALK